ncbi:uncharacterized protein LOC131950675 [Physella acuta]|uniref:uncharacterized protein LOC131950675 n=1 Tax=Physella acuta TaxID=109671 RepID=UPI0027DAD96A|nr:uncharacterized protein LOC131950675 [Physella acuta]XP_059168879.1 uncharacterized protein LOC131950675 [Physella acuta]XP_059168880.1 uncharacterized protein LOC131950675 [Physella acuta]XP_059168881.1 uncharacterized protein LOC131950675 [Physella acuta]XP_059168882.1 uncharacterized protein LOC131950675 [Physella acuta]
MAGYCIHNKFQIKIIFGTLLIFVICFIFASRSNSMCVYFPILMWLRSDACDIWEETDFNSWGDYSWWQRACLLEKDWKNMDYLCKDVRLMGNWPVCFDEPYRPVKDNKPCIVYSFGIANDFRFDDAMAIYNCTVYSFDPSMNVEDHVRGSHVHFKKLGIGVEDNPNFIPRFDGYAKPGDHWNIQSMTSIMKMLGHTPQSISLLKMDVENNEWSILTNLLDAGILQKLPQLLIEWHIFNDSPPHSRYKQMHEDYERMKSAGFLKFWMRNEGRDHWLPAMVTQAEVTYINSKFK